MTKIVLKKETSAIFLAIVLVLGTIALALPSFSVEAQEAENSGNGTLQQGFCLQVNQQNAAAGNDATNIATNYIGICQDTESNDASQDPTIGASSNDNVNGGIISSSVANSEDPQAQTQNIQVLQDGNGVEINKQGILPIDIQQIKSSNNDIGIEIQQQGAVDSSKLTTMEKQPDDLTAMEKITKLKTQWLNQLP
ncbi:MAG TPA: hypothetical protein VFK40_11905 [Nitrososphaeraceae archaeon]|nr:hypothetical protein [Nitrososphaeraceae archaeon]